MPYALVRIDPRKLGGAELVKLVEKLPTIVSEALSVPGTAGKLTSDEIEVKVEHFGPLDIHSKDVQIIIWANDYPERKKNLDERREAITERIIEEFLYPETTCSVWVLLALGSYGEF